MPRLRTQVPVVRLRAAPRLGNLAALPTGCREHCFQHDMQSSTIPDHATQTHNAASTRRTQRPPLTAKMPTPKLRHRAATAAMTTKILPATCVPMTRRNRDAPNAASRFASIASTMASFAVAFTSLMDQASLTNLCTRPVSSSSSAHQPNNARNAATNQQFMRPPLTAKMPTTKLMHHAAPLATLTSSIMIRTYVAQVLTVRPRRLKHHIMLPRTRLAMNATTTRSRQEMATTISKFVQRAPTKASKVAARTG